MSLSGLTLSPRNKILQILKEATGIFVGSLIYAIAIDVFIQPNHIAPGGFIGIAIILNHYLPFLRVGITVVLMNIPLLILGLRRIGLKFFFGTILGTILSSILIDILAPYLPSFTTDPMLAALYGGFIMGAGIGIVFRFYASTGGTDLLAQLIYDFTGLPFGQALMVVDVVIIVASGFVFKDINVPLYSIIAELISNYAIDLAQEGFLSYKVLFIITRKGEDIKKRIFEEIGRGVTEFEVKGGYTKQLRDLLLVAVLHTEVMKVKRIVVETDPESFTIVGDASEIIGQGFKSPKERL
ncbi:MAG: YitT family protein [Caldisericum exile]|uniref:YitT family protein n=1 Tax=Caldisericum exile TaxID=693075 RepID=UPI003C748C9C